MNTMEVTKELITLVTGYDATGLSDEDFQTLLDIAISRLRIMLCDPDLTADAFPVGLLSVLGDLFVWTTTNNPQSDGVQSESAENYSYTLKSDAQANDLVKLRDKYADLIDAYSQCEGKDGIIENASANPLWTPDYYWEQDV